MSTSSRSDIMTVPGTHVLVGEELVGLAYIEAWTTIAEFIVEAVPRQGTDWRQIQMHRALVLSEVGRGMLGIPIVRILLDDGRLGYVVARTGSDRFQFLAEG